MSDQFVVLRDALKTPGLDKVLPPDETVRRFMEKHRHIDLDLLEETRRIDTGRLDIPVYFSICGSDAERITGAAKQMGKGSTPAQAEASAVMELTERFSLFAFQKNDRCFEICSRQALLDRNDKTPVISFEQIARSVHDTSEDAAIAEGFFNELPLKWTRARHLTEGREVWLPFDWFFAINEFNGASAGNCEAEAICQGLSEVVERHVSFLVSRNRLQVPGIDPQSVTDPTARELLNKYQRAGIKLHLSDFTLDTGIPTIAVLAHDPATFPESSEIIWTAGTHPAPQSALIRALTEVAQLAGDFHTDACYEASGLPKLTSLAEAAAVTEAATWKDITTLPDLSHENIRLEVENCVAALARNAMDVFVIDTMHPVLQIPAFYTIIPGARFRELAEGSSISMFTAKLILENQHPLVALAKLKAFEKQLPKAYYIPFYIGNCYLALEEPQKALSCFDRALQRNPSPQDIPSIYAYMGVALKEAGQYDRALEVLQTGLSFEAGRTDILNLMGFCHFKMKAHQKAIDCFKKVLEINPGSGIDYANIASNYRDMGQTEKAIIYYRMALKLDPELSFARTNLAQLEKAS
jgi:ribosomal protein S12 methylthiotransferase accessory factor